MFAGVGVVGRSEEAEARSWRRSLAGLPTGAMEEGGMGRLAVKGYERGFEGRFVPC